MEVLLVRDWLDWYHIKGILIAYDMIYLALAPEYKNFVFCFCLWLNVSHPFTHLFVSLSLISTYKQKTNKFYPREHMWPMFRFQFLFNQKAVQRKCFIIKYASGCTNVTS